MVVNIYICSYAYFWQNLKRKSLHITSLKVHKDEKTEFFNMTLVYLEIKNM